MSLARFSEKELRRLAQALLQTAGARDADAQLVADSLIDADRRGVHTHGLARLGSYIDQIAVGEIDVAAEPELREASGSVATIDGRRAFGAVLGVMAMDEACARSEVHGVGIVAVRDTTHFGTAAYYPRRAATRGLVGFTTTNTPAVMAPFGGIDPLVGNNPFAMAAPLSDKSQFVFDIAQTNVARGRIKLAELRGEKIPDNWAIDDAGHSTTDPSAALDGALLPFGGHKGYGIALSMEILAGVLTGAGLAHELLNTGFAGRVAPTAKSVTARGVGNLHIALNPEFFVGLQEFIERSSAMVRAVRSSRLATGAGEILIPGEMGARSEALADEHGVEVDTSTITDLMRMARDAGVPVPALEPSS